MIELSDLTVRPAVALPKDFDGVVFLECKMPISRKFAENLDLAFHRLLPNAKCMVLDDNVRIARIETQPETVTS